MDFSYPAYAQIIAKNKENVGARGLICRHPGTAEYQWRSLCASKDVDVVL